MKTSRCPKCDADFDAGPIPKEIRRHYAGDRFWRVISVQENDRHDHWECPDCGHKWK